MTHTPTLRLLAVLELLQSRSEVSGQELAQTLEVEERSIRRYVMLLRDIGIPIQSERGRHGGYSLLPGFRLPPLMFNADEMTAVVVGLMLMRESGATPLLAVESAAAKIARVLPVELRQRTEALRAALVLDDLPFPTYGVSSAFLTTLSLAAYARQNVRIGYTSSDGADTERRISPYGIVLHATRWYVPAYCHLRQETRLFRLDRVRALDPTDETFTPPVGFDARAFVLAALARLPGMHACEILIEADLTTVQATLPPSVAVLEADGTQTRMRCYTDDVGWLARQMVRLELPFKVLADEALKEALRALAAELAGSVEA
jgi:predicted DNA-binding transcriptional regulator YafY